MYDIPPIPPVILPKLRLKRPRRTFLTLLLLLPDFSSPMRCH